MHRLHRIAVPFLLMSTTYYCVHRSADKTILHNEIFSLLFTSRYPYLKRFDDGKSPAQSSADFCELLDQVEMFKSK